MAGDERVLTVVVPQGQGAPLLELLASHGIHRAALGSARAPVTYTARTGGFARTVNVSVEKDILTAVLPAERADAVFALVHEAAAIATRPGGFMFMGRAAKATPFVLSDKRTASAHVGTQR
jgi:hypothetical protein